MLWQKILRNYTILNEALGIERLRGIIFKCLFLFVSVFLYPRILSPLSSVLYRQHDEKNPPCKCGNQYILRQDTIAFRE